MNIAWLLANYHCLGPRRCADALGCTPEQATAQFHAALRRKPKDLWPIAKAYWLHEHRHDFTEEALADMLSLPLPVVQRRLDLLSCVAPC
jgi:hypothetical protein